MNPIPPLQILSRVWWKFTPTQKIIFKQLLSNPFPMGEQMHQLSIIRNVPYSV